MRLQGQGLTAISYQSYQPAQYAHRPRGCASLQPHQTIAHVVLAHLQKHPLQLPISGVHRSWWRFRLAVSAVSASACHGCCRACGKRQSSSAGRWSTSRSITAWFTEKSLKNNASAFHLSACQPRQVSTAVSDNTCCMPPLHSGLLYLCSSSLPW